MIDGATWILWAHVLAAAAWLGGAAVVMVAILPTLNHGGSSGIVVRAHFLWKRPDIRAAARKARLGLGAQLILGAAAALLGLTLRLA